MTHQLRHEHLIRINDPSLALEMWLTRAQLWSGLLHTVFEPQEFDESIDSVAIEEILPGRLRRRIRRGTLTLDDEVELVENDRLRIDADPAGIFAGSRFEIRIEEPDAGMLFVRFIYEIQGLPAIRDEKEDHARRSAYQASDLERIRLVRRYAAAAVPTLQ